ncbi:MAG: copper transporter [Mycobacteriales bacterium]
MSFRYHLTSLAAVLLALAVGIVVGTTSLSAEPPPAKAPVAAVPGDTTGEDLAQRVQSRLLRDALPDQRVLLLLAPDVPAGSARTVTAALKSAGSTVAAQVQLLPTLLDTSGKQTVDGVVAGTAPATLSLPSSGTLERAGALLAAALVTSDQGSDVTGISAQKVIGGFSGGSLIAVDGPPAGRATLVLLLSGPSRGPSLATLASAFQARVGTVVAGTPASARGRGVVAVLRAQSRGVSDVDGLGTSTGLLGAVLALDEQASGRAGHYGTGPGATGIVPDLG